MNLFLLFDWLLQKLLSWSFIQNRQICYAKNVSKTFQQFLYTFTNIFNVYTYSFKFAANKPFQPHLRWNILLVIIYDSLKKFI